MLSGGSPSAKLRADEQKSHKRPSSRGELAQDNEAHRFEEYGKCGSCAVTVHVLIWGGLFNLRWRLSMMIDSWATAINVPATWLLSASGRANPIATRQLPTAPAGATFPVIKQKSADGIVPKVIGAHRREGLNISQEAARLISIQCIELAVKRGSES
jgi:hypothetical protein